MRPLETTVSGPDTKPPAPSAAPGAGGDGFLSRWSRRKRAAEAGQPLPEPAPSTPATPAQSAPVEGELPDPATLSFDDDFTRYLGAQVPAALKRTAMAKLFSDPCFNQMDGLDVYVEDYNLVPDLPAAERDLLAHAKAVLDPTPVAESRGLPSTEPTRTAKPSPPVADAPVLGEPPSTPQATASPEVPSGEADGDASPATVLPSRT